MTLRLSLVTRLCTVLTRCGYLMQLLFGILSKCFFRYSIAFRISNIVVRVCVPPPDQMRPRSLETMCVVSDHANYLA
uniref:Putative secreted peptide n=1 Tax=Anopheles braziliensis TaxID=58242 RepID=A0A2M3ZUX1_9DIPT